MTAVLDAVLPVFGLILTGYLCGRPRARGAHEALLGPSVTDGLNRFVVWLALPALLFLAMSRVTAAQLDHVGFVAGFTCCMVITFGLGWLAIGRRRGPDGRTLTAIESLAACYANTGFMGFPLSLVVFGEAGQPAVVVATLLTACVMFGVVIALIEIDRAGGGRRGAVVARVTKTLLRNPLLLAPLLGSLMAASGLVLPSALERFIALLGAAASPCALVTIGLFIAQQTRPAPVAPVAVIVVLKLLVQPALTAILVTWVFDMPQMWARSAILLSALPVGTGPFMLAQLYQREAAVASRAILMSTIVSAFTISALIAWWH